MIMPKYRELFKPYSGKIMLENAINWLLNEAKKRNIREDIAELAIHETFLLLAQGKTFSKYRCSCGCGLANPHSDLIHYTRHRMIQLHEDVMGKYLDLLQQKMDARVKAYLRHTSISKRVGRFLLHGLKSLVFLDFKENRVKWTK